MNLSSAVISGLMMPLTDTQPPNLNNGPIKARLNLG
jgi:hypothetical protein